MSKVPSTRWCPTPEQLLILDKLYRSGMGAPNAMQIQQIIAFLSPYGRIEGKNVFYWFQNHKARERQRLKKRLMSGQQQLLHQQPYQHGSCSNPPTHQLPLLEFPFPPPLPPPIHLLHHPCILPQFQMVHHGENHSIKLSSKVEEACENEMGQLGSINPPLGFEEGSFANTEVGGPATAGSRPLVTLELFPTKSTGLKDELTSPSNSRSTSCSTFT